MKRRIEWIVIVLLAAATVFFAVWGLGKPDCPGSGGTDAFAGEHPDSGKKQLPSKQDKYFAFSGENLVTLRVSYIGCACGPEYPQYHIDSVLSTENEQAAYFPNKEISLVFVDAELEKRLAGPDCASRCYHYILTGNFEANGYGMYRLRVTEGKVVVDDQCCEKER
jgi:hypothetical protein